MSDSGWHISSKVYSAVCEKYDALITSNYPERKPQSGSAEEKELSIMTQTSDILRKSIESIREIDRENYIGSRDSYIFFPTEKIILDVIEGRKKNIEDYQNAELYQLLSYDYQILGTEYANQQISPEKILYYYEQAILCLNKALTFGSSI